MNWDEKEKQMTLRHLEKLKQLKLTVKESLTREIKLNSRQLQFISECAETLKESNERIELLEQMMNDINQYMKDLEDTT